jgi:hypothetical protein
MTGGKEIDDKLIDPCGQNPADVAGTAHCQYRTPTSATVGGSRRRYWPKRISISVRMTRLFSEELACGVGAELVETPDILARPGPALEGSEFFLHPRKPLCRNSPVQLSARKRQWFRGRNKSCTGR